MNTTDNQPLLRNPTKSELPGLLVELEESGLGVAVFARERKFKPQSLYVARRRQVHKAEPQTVFDPVRIVGAVDSHACFQLELQSGHKLVVPPDFESSALRRLLEVLSAC